MKMNHRKTCIVCEKLLVKGNSITTSKSTRYITCSKQCSKVYGRDRRKKNWMEERKNEQ